MFNLYNFVLISKMISIHFLWFDSAGLSIELWRNEKLQKHGIILSQHINYLHKCLVHFFTYYCCQGLILKIKEASDIARK